LAIEKVEEDNLKSHLVAPKIIKSISSLFIAMYPRDKSHIRTLIS
jgi:hypothetical protein